jgi:hypothetical protein
VTIADLDKNFRLKELVDQPWYYELLARERERLRDNTDSYKIEHLQKV